MFQLGKVLQFATILEQIGFTTPSPTRYCCSMTAYLDEMLDISILCTSKYCILVHKDVNVTTLARLWVRVGVSEVNWPPEATMLDQSETGTNGRLIRVRVVITYAKLCTVPNYPKLP